MARELKRLNINMTLDLVARVDDYADRMGINRTTAICVLTSIALDTQKATNTMDELVKLINDEKSKAVNA